MYVHDNQMLRQFQRIGRFGKARCTAFVLIGSHDHFDAMRLTGRLNIGMVGSNDDARRLAFCRLFGNAHDHRFAVNIRQGFSGQAR